GARRVVSERVIIKKELTNLGKRLLRPGDLLNHMTNAARAVSMAAHSLRPQAERAARFAAATCIERQIRMQQIADEVVPDGEVACVQGCQERRRAEGLKDRAVLAVPGDAIAITIREAGDLSSGASRRTLLDGEVEFVARDKIDDGGSAQASFR